MTPIAIRLTWIPVVVYLCLGMTTARAQIQNDPFNASELQDGWTFEDPNGNDHYSLSARPGWLQIEVTSPDEDMWSTGRGGAPLLLTPLAEGTTDIRLETYVDLASSNGGYPSLNSVGGLVVCDGGNDAGKEPFELTLGLQHNWSGGTEVILQKPGESFKWASPGANAVYLRIDRKGKDGAWTAYYRVHADHEWIRLASLTDQQLPGAGITGELRVGLFAKTWDADVGDAAKVDFAYFGDTEPVSGKKPNASVTPTVDVASLRTFCVSGKERGVLNGYGEAEILRQSGRGCLTHMWFGGDWPGYERTRIRVYVDGAAEPSIDMELGLGHGYGFGDASAPWGTAKLGKTGHPSGIYNTYKIPFGNGVRVTAQRFKDSPDGAPFWWIVRGTENLPVTIAGVRLPDTARLVLHRLENHLAQPYEEFDFCTTKGSGAVYQVTMAADGQRDAGDWKDISYLEAIVRAYVDDSPKPLQLSSGLEDYFLGTYYFNRGTYANELAGLTHLDKKDNTFSAYRFHDDDPLFFQKRLRMTCRCGEEIGGQQLHDPPPTRFTIYTWVYEW